MNIDLGGHNAGIRSPYPHGVHRVLDVYDVAAIKAAHKMNDDLTVADSAQELVSEAGAL